MSPKRRQRRAPRAHQPGASAPRRQPLLDACLIVKDEELHLPDCLASLQRLGPRLNSINVYDTGSTDNTVQIARAAGCHVVEGYWDDDFARARNESLGMSDALWAIVIDADERVFANADTLLDELECHPAANVVDAELYHVDDSGERYGHTRYIKMVKPGEIRFAHPVHEVVTGRDGQAIAIQALAPETLHFTHLGYATPAIRQRKAERNHGLADAAVAQARTGGDKVLLAHALRHRARSWIGPNSSEQAIRDFAEAGELWPEGSAEWVTNTLDIAGRQRSVGDMEGTMRTLGRLRTAGVPERLWRGIEAELMLTREDHVTARDIVDAMLATEVPLACGGVVHGPYLDRREVLDLRLRIALNGQEHAVSVAICVLLINAGEVERVNDLCTLWMRSPQALAAALRDGAGGTHGHAVIRALEAAPGAGPLAARILRTSLVAQGRGPTVDGVANTSVNRGMNP